MVNMVSGSIQGSLHRTALMETSTWPDNPSNRLSPIADVVLESSSFYNFSQMLEFSLETSHPCNEKTNYK